jgi:hypothetical protein
MLTICVRSPSMYVYMSLQQGFSAQEQDPVVFSIFHKAYNSLQNLYKTGME